MDGLMSKRRGALQNGWYGLVAIDGEWRQVTILQSRRTLMLSEIKRANATHVGYWNGRDWDHIVKVGEI